MSSDTTTKRKEGRFSQHVRTARDVGREPRLIFPLVRRWLLNLWRIKGGGFYGLGYVIAFVTLEIRSLGGDITGSESIGGFIASQAVQYVIRLSVESLINAVLALVWPIYIVAWLGPLGLVVLAAGFLAFRYGLRPVVEAWFPELREPGQTNSAAERNANEQ